MSRALRSGFGLLGSFLLTAFASTAMAEPEVCVADGRVFSVGAEVCFGQAQFECEQFNAWTYRGSCKGAKIPETPREVNSAEDIDGSLCLMGTYYSPGYEGCFSGVYQKCGPDGSWRESRSLDGVECP